MELNAQKRSITGKGVQTLRAEGRMPAVVYGAQEDSIAIEVATSDFTRVFKDAGESTIIKLSIDGEVKNVLIHEIDIDPLANEPRHADFYIVKKGQKVEVEIPIEFTGESSAVKELGANVIKALHEITIEAEATNLPHEFVVDISSLKTLDDTISAGDISLPAGVTLITDPEETVVTLAMPEEETEESAEEPDMDAIGISEDRGKKEEEGDSEESDSEKQED
ncbi:MAG: 50S ribosomal protein L25 [Patescibacteria group bacterium UBA2163]